MGNCNKRMPLLMVEDSQYPNNKIHVIEYKEVIDYLYKDEFVEPAKNLSNTVPLGINFVIKNGSSLSHIDHFTITNRKVSYYISMDHNGSHIFLFSDTQMEYIKPFLTMYRNYTSMNGRFKTIKSFDMIEE